MSLYNDDVNLNDIGDDEVVTETPQNEITDESTNPPIVIDNPIEYDEIDFDDDNFQGGGGESIPVISPPTELDPVGYANMVSKTFSTRLVITDYTQSFLEDLYNQGAEFHAVYLDGYDEVISWQEIADPYPSAAEAASSEILSLTEAIGQHFWIGDDGIHVTEANEEDYLANHYGHSMLINSYGLLMRNNECNLVGITQSAITFYDGAGNESTNITALFGPTTIIGRENKAHVQINYQGFDVYNTNEESMATIKTLNDENGNLTITFKCHVTKHYRTVTQGQYDEYYIALHTGDAGYAMNILMSIRTDTDPSTVICDEPIVFADPQTTSYVPMGDVHFYENQSSDSIWYQALDPYVDQDVLVTIFTTKLYGSYGFGVRNPGYIFGANSLVVGDNNSATGLASFAHGENNEAVASYSHAEGYDTYASGVGSHAEGYQTIAQGGYVGKTAYNHAEGFQTKARALASHAEGSGSEVKAPGEYGHAEGYNTKVGYKYDPLQEEIQQALDTYFPLSSYPNRRYVDHSKDTYIAYTVYPSTSENGGISRKYSYRYKYGGMAAHAEGYQTEARSDFSHAEGKDTLVDLSAYAGHTMGIGTVAKSPYCLVIGEYNNYAFDDETEIGGGNYRRRLFVVGAGSSDYRKNAFTVDQEGVWAETLECNNIKTCPYKVGDVYFTTTNYGTTGPPYWMTSYNQSTGQYTYATWTKLTFTAISGVYAYKRVS